jgi:hypothetical protein
VVQYHHWCSCARGSEELVTSLRNSLFDATDKLRLCTGLDRTEASIVVLPKKDNHLGTHYSIVLKHKTNWIQS